MGASVLVGLYTFGLTTYRIDIETCRLLKIKEVRWMVRTNLWKKSQGPHEQAAADLQTSMLGWTATKGTAHLFVHSQLLSNKNQNCLIEVIIVCL